MITAVLARLIPPSEFGLLAMVTVITGFLGVFKNFGLNASLIHKQNITDKDINTVFWFTVFVSALLAFIIILSAPLISRFYNNPRLTSITIAMGVLFFISTLGSVPDALIQKKMLFKSFFFRNITNKIISGITGISLAYLGFGIWALITSNFVSTIYITYVSFRIIRWRPKLFFSVEVLKPHLSYSLPLLGLRIINYWSSNLDTLIVGKKFGDNILGYYNKSYSLMMLPVSKVSGAVSRVVFPSFSLIQQDPEQVWKKYIRLLRTTAFITFPLMGAMYLLADVIIITVYGENWKPSIPFFKAFAFIGAVQSLTYTGTIFQSIGKTKKVFYLNIVLKSLVITGILIGYYLGGIMGIIWGFTLASVFAFLINTRVLSNELGYGLQDLIRGLYREFLLTLVIVLVLALVITTFRIEEAWIKSILVLLSGGGLYLYCADRLQLEGYRFFIQKIKKSL